MDCETTELFNATVGGAVCVYSAAAEIMRFRQICVNVRQSVDSLRRVIYSIVYNIVSQYYIIVSAQK